jgi:hypothetical protein
MIYKYVLHNCMLPLIIEVSSFFLIAKNSTQGFVVVLPEFQLLCSTFKFIQTCFAVITTNNIIKHCHWLTDYKVIMI